MNDAVDLSRLPDGEREARIRRWEARMMDLKNTRYGPTTAAFPLLLMPAIDLFSHSFGRIRGEIASTIVLLAAERQRRRTGAWPGSIAEIADDLLPERPVDPFGGGPLHFEHRDGRLLVYSIGRNLRDDHGQFDSRGRTDGPFDAGTLAWDVPLRRRPPSLPDLPEQVFEGGGARERPAR